MSSQPLNQVKNIFMQGREPFQSALTLGFSTRISIIHFSPSTPPTHHHGENHTYLGDDPSGLHHSRFVFQQQIRSSTQSVSFSGAWRRTRQSDVFSAPKYSFCQAIRRVIRTLVRSHGCWDSASSLLPWRHWDHWPSSTKSPLPESHAIEELFEFLSSTALKFSVHYSRSRQTEHIRDNCGIYLCSFYSQREIL